MRYVAAALLAALGGNEQNYFLCPLLRFSYPGLVKRSNAELNEIFCPGTTLMAN